MNLSSVSKTLFFTLCSRAADHNFQDPLALEIFQNNPEIKIYLPDFLTRKLIINRAHFFDNQVRINKLKYSNEMLALINLGGGLCSRFDRVKNEITNSIHIDLPAVIDLFQHLFPKKPNHLISADLNNLSWITKVAERLNAKEVPIFCMEGVSMYLEKKVFLHICHELPNNFSSGVFICDLLHPVFSGRSYLVRSVSQVGANFTSGIYDTKEILQVSPKLNLEIVKAPFTIPFNLYQFATFSWGL